jgi:HEAT repeat protein
MEPRTRSELAKILQSSATFNYDVRSSIVDLSRIGNPEDASLLAPFLSQKDATLREPAAIALARFGDEGLPWLAQELNRGSVKTRASVMAALSQATTSKAAELFERGLRDKSPLVRLTALSIWEDLPAALRGNKATLLAFAKRRLKFEADPSVRRALLLLH